MDPNDQPASPATPESAPFTDVTPLPMATASPGEPGKNTALSTPPNSEPAPMPVEPVAPPVEADEDPVELIRAEAKEDHKPAPQPAKQAQLASNGVGAAIAATVIIVLGLAILAVYAYLQSK